MLAVYQMVAGLILWSRRGLLTPGLSWIRPQDMQLISLLPAVLSVPVCAAEYSPFYGIEKGAVLQEARIFHDPNLDSRRCSQVGGHDFNVCNPHSLNQHKQVACSIGWLRTADLVHCDMQVITKLLYLLHQGETFTKVGSAGRVVWQQLQRMLRQDSRRRCQQP